MNRIVVAALAALAAGCATSPAELIEKGQQSTYQSTKPPRELALCITRNAEAGLWRANYREEEAAGHYQVAVSEIAGAYLAIARVGPQGGGAIARISAQHVFPHPSASELAAVITAGC